MIQRIRKLWRQLFYPIILGRVACVGKDVLQVKHKDFKYIKVVNLQKVRFDLFLEWIVGAKRPESSMLKTHMDREDVFSLIVEQDKLEWLNIKRNIKYLIIDSFAELTDQKFTHRKEGWSFCCHYTDLKHTDEFDKEFECDGLLDVEKLEDIYQRFFDWFEQKYPNKKVIFLHYSTKFDDREEYRTRANEILRVMNKLTEEKNYIINLHMEDSSFSPHEEDDCPYHYSQATYVSFVDKWKKLELGLFRHA